MLAPAAEFHPSDDTVPIALRLVGDAVGVLSDADILDAVVHTDGNGIALARDEALCHIVLMGSGERHLVPHLPAVDIDGGLNMGAFQEERHTLVSPVAGDIDALTVPRLADEMLLWCEKKWELHITLTTVLLHPRVEVVRRVVGRTCPAGIGRHGIAFPVGEQRPRQHHIVVVMRRIVEGEIPGARQADDLLSGGCDN